MKTIVISNSKGGVGKTTTCLCLAAGIKEKKPKAKVLLVDLDSQLNLTYSCGIDIENDLEKSTLYDVFHKQAQITDCIFQIYDDISDFDIVVGGVNMREAEKEDEVNDKAFISVFNALKSYYDYIVIDTPPKLEKITELALLVADDLIIPIKPDIYSYQGLGGLLGVANKKLKKEYNKNINISGLLIAGIDERPNFSRGILSLFKQIANNNNTKVFKTMIHNGIAIQESQFEKKTLYQHAPKSRVAIDYMNFVNEYLKGVI